MPDIRDYTIEHCIGIADGTLAAATDCKGQLMARWRKPTKEEVLQNRRTLAERARSGDLRLPGAVAEIRKGIGMTQEEFAKALGLSRRQIA